MTAAVVLTVAFGLLVMWLWRKATQSWLIQAGWRFFTGLDLDGQPRPHKRPRHHRAATRIGSVAVMFGLLYGLAVAHTVTIWAVAGLVVAGIGTGAWWLWRRVRHLRHHWRYVRPLRRALTPVLEGGPPRLAIEPDRTWAKIALPPGFIGTDREWEMIDRTVHVKLGIEAPKRNPQLQGAKPYVIYTKSDDPPPARVSLADIRPRIEAAAEHEVVLGLGIKDAPIIVSVDNDSPHIGLSMGSGDGKSVTARNMAAQLAYHGALLVFLDYKLVSHMWARDLPNVCYAGTIQEIHHTLCWLAWDDLDDNGDVSRASEMTRRKQVVRYGTDHDQVFHGDVGPRMFIVCEELNATQGRLRAYWKRIGGKGPSPASEALDEAQFIGREVGANALLIAQRLSAKASSGSGSADSRENLGVKIFHDPEESTWKMLVGKRHALPPASGHKGRLQVVTAKEVSEVQGAFLTPREARALAVAGTVAIPQPDMPCITQRAGVLVPVTADALPHGGPDQPNVLVTSPVPTRPLGAVTLREAVEAGVFGGRSLVAVRRERGRRPDFPAEVGVEYGHHLYDVTALSAYVTERSRR